MITRKGDKASQATSFEAAWRQKLQRQFTTTPTVTDIWGFT